MDEFISHDIPVEKERSRSPKDKHVAVNGSDLDTDDHENPSDELFCNFLQGQGRGSEQINPIQFETYNANLDKFFDFGPPPNGGEPLPTESKFTRAASNGVSAFFSFFGAILFLPDFLLTLRIRRDF